MLGVVKPVCMVPDTREHTAASSEVSVHGARHERS